MKLAQEKMICYIRRLTRCFAFLHLYSALQLFTLHDTLYTFVINRHFSTHQRCDLSVAVTKLMLNTELTNLCYNQLLVSFLVCSFPT